MVNKTSMSEISDRRVYKYNFMYFIEIIMKNSVNILNKTLLYIDKIDSLISNIPRSDYYYKDKIIDESYLLMEYIIRANNSNDVLVRNNCLIEILVRISIIDRLLSMLYKRRYIDISEYSYYGNILNEIYNYYCV